MARLVEEGMALELATTVLAGGGIAAIPTETVYGLAADASNGHAVARVFEAKGRPRFNPLIAHVADIEMAQHLAVFRSPVDAPRQRLLAGSADARAATPARCDGA